jgi:poly-gamma-glutamate synthesis protein (capsule biosynthesis protein)
MTAFAYATATREGIDQIGFLPCKLTPDGRVHPLRLESTEATDVVRFLETCNSTQGLRGVITSSGSIPLAGFETLRVAPA